MAYAMNVNIPDNTIPGNYYLLFVADPENTVPEQDENNNVSYVALSVLSQGGGGSPVSIFSVDNSFIGAGTTVNFTDMSSNNPTSWQWSFPGGTPSYSTTQNPSVTYGTNGVFDVSLTSTNSSGSNTLTQSDYISVGQVPEYDWIWSQTSNDIKDLSLDSEENIITVGNGNFTKYNSEGAIIWSKNISGTALAVHANDDITVVGSINGFIDFGNGVTLNNNEYNSGTDIYICKYNSDGVCLWAKMIYNTDLWNDATYRYMYVVDVCCDESGNSYLVGYYEGLYGGSDYLYVRFPNNISLRNVNQSTNLMIAKFSNNGTNNSIF